LNKRFHDGNLEYQVKWVGFNNPEDNTWEPVVNLNCTEMIEQFEKSYDNKEFIDIKTEQFEEDEIPQDELALFCSTVLANLAGKKIYTIDYFDTSYGVLMSRDCPSTLEFCVALIHEVLANLKPTHKMWNKLKYAAFLLNLATRNNDFNQLYSIYHQVEDNVKRRKMKWNDEILGTFVDEKVGELLSNKENGHNNFIIEEKYEEFKGKKESMKLEVIDPDDGYVYEPKRESKFSMEEEFFHQHYLQQNLTEEITAESLAAPETENGRKAKISMKRKTYNDNDFEDAMKKAKIKKRKKGERKAYKMTPQVIEAILKIRRENPGFKASKVRQELIKLEICNEKTVPHRGSINKLGDGYGNPIYVKKRDKPAALVSDKWKYCSQCDFKSKVERNLDKHCFDVHETNRLCTKCGHLSDNYDQYIQHLKTHPVKCPICNRLVAVNNRRSLELHISKMHKEQNEEDIIKVPCDMCGKLVNEKSLQSHQKMAHGNKTVKCDVCNSMFVTEAAMLKHREQHFKSNSTCPECGKQVKHLAGHLRIMHSNRERHSCDLCEQTFKLKQGLKRHIQVVHHNIKKFQCEDCDFRAESSFNLRTHRTQVHERKKWFEICQFCNKKSGHLEAHHKKYHFVQYMALKGEGQNAAESVHQPEQNPEF